MENKSNGTSILKKVMISGPSGIGKTTLAKDLADFLKIPFVSGSKSDLQPETKLVKQIDLIKEPSYDSELQLLNLRSKIFKQYNEFISDRGYLDNIVYTLYKLSHIIQTCEMESFEDMAYRLLYRDCTHLILLPFDYGCIKSFEIEDNNKRITNPYFQWMIYSIYISCLFDKNTLSLERDQKWEKNYEYNGYYNYYKSTLKIDDELKSIKVLTLNTSDYKARLNIAKSFLEW